MKRVNKLILTGAIAILGVAACNKPEPVTDNPTYNKDTKEVTAEFILSVSTNRENAKTKMTAETVQADGSFRGMDEVHLLTYKLGYAYHRGQTDSTLFLYKVSDPTSKATRDFNLGTVMVQGEVSENQSSKVLEISLPLETNAVLLYGRAPRTKARDEHGSVTAVGTPLGNSVGDISFSLDNRLSSYDAFDQFGSMISRVLTGIMKSGRTQETQAQGYAIPRDNRYKFWWPIDENSAEWNRNEDWVVDGVELLDGNTTYHSGYTLHIGSKLWRDYGIAYADGATMRPMEELLGEMYTNITTIRTKGEGETMITELRAASAPAILRLSTDVYEQLRQVINGNVTSWEDYVAVLVAQEIATRARSFFAEEGNTGNIAWKGFDSFKSAFTTFIGIDFEDTYPLVTKYFFNGAETGEGFPMNLGLPSGAALMRFDTRIIAGAPAEVVSMLKSIPSYGMGSASSSLDIRNYRYPAELMYWTNSSIRTNDEPVESTLYPKTVATWDVTDWDGWDSNSKVISSTRSVAITKEVNYGTALLKTTVKYGADLIHDNRSGIFNEDDQVIDVKKNANMFKVTGVLIGGVEDEVGWDFLPRNNNFNTMIYDRLGTSQQFYIPQYPSTSGPVYTMTWDNYNNSLEPDAQGVVFVAVEFVNNTGKDIWGGLNLIRNGGTFYLVGKLDPTKEASLKNLPTKKVGGVDVIDLSRDNFNYPPFDANGETISAPRVFMQDYMTNVVFSFNKHSMRNAYVTMPDLKSSNVSLGLSVDLEWEDGLDFQDIPLGGEQSDEELNH